MGQQDLSMRLFPQAWKPPLYAQSDFQIETQDGDDNETRVIQTIEDNGKSGISDLNDINLTQSQ